jgi:hypothetical protein
VSTGTVTNSLTLPETVVLTESFIKQVNRAIGETVALAEAFVVSLFRPMAETVVLTEQLQESVIPSGSSTLPPMVHLSVRIGIRIG